MTNFICFRTGSEEASMFLFDKLLDHGVIIRPLKANNARLGKSFYRTKRRDGHFFTAMDKILPEYDKKFRSTVL